MIAEFEDAAAPNHTDVAYRALRAWPAHKHVPEMQAYAGLDAPAGVRARRSAATHRACWSRSRCRWGAAGRADAGRGPRGAGRAYAGEPFVEVASLDESGRASRRLDPEGLNGTNRMRLFVFGNAQSGPGAAGGAARQPRQGRLGRGGAEPQPGARPARRPPGFADPARRAWTTCRRWRGCIATR